MLGNRPIGSAPIGAPPRPIVHEDSIAAGGIAFGGGAVVGRGRGGAAAGAIEIGGAAIGNVQANIIAAGQFSFGGGAVVGRARGSAAAGTIAVAAGAISGRARDSIAAGGITIDGGAIGDAFHPEDLAAVGAITIGGSGIVGRHRGSAAAGGMAIGGGAVGSIGRDRRPRGTFAALIEITAWDPVAGAAVTLRASSVNDDRVCHLDGQTWWPVAAKLPVLRYDLFDGAFGGQIGTPAADLALSIEPWEDFARYALADARIRIWTGGAGDAFGDFTLRFDGRLTAQPTIKSGIATLPFAVDDRWLDQPLLATYAGSGGLEGHSALKGQVKPLAIGAPRFVPGQMIDTVNNVIQLSAYGAIQGVQTAFERVIDRGPSLGDYPSYAALVAATLPAGTWATSKADGLLRLGAPPVGMLSHHVQGDNSGPDGWARTPGKVIKRIALLAGGSGKFSEASLDALDSARPWNVSVYQAQQTTARQLIQRIAASVNAVAGVDWTGQLFVIPIGYGSPILTLNGRGEALPPVGRVEQMQIGAPFWRLALESEKTWQVHALTDVAFWSTLQDRGDYSATEVYYEGNIVQSGGSSWIYINPTPTSGNAPPTLPTTSNAWWRAFVQEGPQGDQGDKKVIVYRRSSSAPATPTGNGIPASWSASPPSGSTALWMSTSTQTAADVLIGSWSTPVLITGDRYVIVYRRSATAPSTPTGNGTPSGWSTSPPAGTDILWMSTALQDGSGTTLGSWSTPARVTGDVGPTGSAGRDAIPYYQTATPPSPVEGDTWLNPSTHEWKRYTSGSWEVPLGALAALSIITEAYIQTANVITAHIKDLNVTTLKVANGAVSSVTVFSSAPVVQINAGAYQDIGSPAAQVSVTTETTAAAANQAVLVRTVVLMHRTGGSNDKVTFRCLRSDGVQVGQTWSVEVTNDAATYMFEFVDTSPPANSTPSYKIQGFNTVGTPWVDQIAVSGQLGKK